MVPWWHRREFFQALAIPLFVFGGLMQIWRYTWDRMPAWANWLFWLAYGIGFVWCVVTCHRLVLVGTTSTWLGLVPKWSWRETRFYLWLIAIVLICAGTGIFLSTVCLSALANFMKGEEEFWAGWIQFAVRIPVIYLFARFSLIYPATAIDRKVNLKWAWRQTKGNGWRLAFVITFLPWALSRGVNLLYREQATAAEILILVAIGCVLMVIDVAALSLSYRELADVEDSASAPSN